MFLLESPVDGAPKDLIFTASDLVTAAECEFQVLRKLDVKLERSTKAVFESDEMAVRAAELGDVHERRVRRDFTTLLGAHPGGKGVKEIEEVDNYTRAELTAKHQESMAALRCGHDVVFQASFFDGELQASFFDGELHGRSDFLVKETAPDGGVRYAVWDTKLARHAKVTALLQLAAHGDQLARAGITPSPVVTLVLGDNVHSTHSLTDLLPVFKERRDRFRAITAEHRASDAPVTWGEDRYGACGRCDYCSEQVKLHRDLLMVANMSVTRRRTLMAQGITTIDALAAMDLPAEEKGALARLREQARMQTGIESPDGAVEVTDKHGAARTVSYRVLEENALATLPVPDAGEIFFDFEGDPMWQDETGRWGLGAGGSSTCSASSRTQPTAAGHPSGRSGPTAASRRDGRRRGSWSTSPNGGSATRGCGSTTTRTMRRPRCADFPSTTSSARTPWTSCCGRASSSTSTTCPHLPADLGGPLLAGRTRRGDTRRVLVRCGSGRAT
ncbi:MAG: hypothetical protein JJE50_08995 [Actinomycetales bacterium]|nr:hypothetical protein [Actinomycetales bacterium]